MVVGVRKFEGGVVLQVAYGTTQRTTTLRAGEFLISKDKNPVAIKQAGLAFDTKFDLNKVVELPWTERYFKTPPSPAYGQSPDCRIQRGAEIGPAGPRISKPPSPRARLRSARGFFS
jgi:hypothetical protein